ncbi:hypothetical protein F66182_7607 [Fusarium sp. NRRL 66182]|nr:hypothetical protein F66182_7607 [Fusarium sp. NRRL 66182]
MNVGRNAPSSNPTRIASPTVQHSNRESPYPPSTTSAATDISSIAAASAASTTTLSAMAMPGFLPQVHAFRPTIVPSIYGSSMRETPRSGTTSFAPSPSPAVRVLVRRLPLNTSEESLRFMVIWSQELQDVELLRVEQSEDQGFRSALLRFRTMAGAQEAKNMLDGRSNISNDAHMIVEILSNSPIIARRHPTETSSANTSSSTSSAASVSSTTGPRQVSRFNGTFQSLENMSPQTTSNAYHGHELPNPERSTHYQNLFSPQSPIGNHLTERGVDSGKTLIAEDSADDDETSDLLKDPVAYAENGATTQRRATAPQIPIGRLAALSLNTNNMPQPGPASLPHYMNVMSAQSGPMSPPDKTGFGVSFTNMNSPYPRNNFPPVNPADQNPPCNTLYVGNLPIDTSEEELKALFSKQRGYKRLCFRTKQNGPMCFVEFEDISFATKALHELYGQLLHNSVKGGIRLSFSKNPLGVRSGQTSTHPSSNSNGGMNAAPSASPNGFGPTANRPPPGLAAPPGLVNSRPHYQTTGYAGAGFPGMTNYSWNGAMYNSHAGSTSSGISTPPANFPPSYMMGR